MGATLTLFGIQAGYGGNTILHGVDLQLPAGGALTVIGPNGSGKSTLLKTVVGLLRPHAGSILLDSHDLSQADAPARARAGMAYVPQEDNVFLNLSVLDNLRLGWEFLQGRTSAVRSSVDNRIEQVLLLFPEIRPHLRKSAGLLSGGQRQMVAMASALMQTPSLLVLDEPSAGLSPKNAALMFESIARIRQTGISLLLIEQNVKLGLAAADTGLLLVAGQVRLIRPAAALARDPDLHQLYLGKS
ncbi:branched-chain amino acid transport system ATP-binding protein [Herbaspirillum sp. Sphag1AN]|uniref:ABC transporter ATP-binding protein n=1 Tax=unclassified Herbaspirillum TaxID=2624150 RepID=UPI001607627C|nr:MULTISPECIES: ABC transporter ATP-binding protein [unclassified Herbaspirillum]MBB3211841.1 branched-chain amino acid transport system ATP-binding protein [Herbaspirillum sp. Sphag1AN]MBB3244325.1 branched-chain amino acid transport system ATP-binding protein [Herbaspirillum sp. Sphag64]